MRESSTAYLFQYPIIEKIKIIAYLVTKKFNDIQMNDSIFNLKISIDDQDMQ